MDKLILAGIAGILTVIMGAVLFQKIHDRNLQQPSDPVTAQSVAEGDKINDPAENTVADAPAQAPEKAPVNPLIGKRVSLSGSVYFGHLPQGTTGTIVGVPGSDDSCGNQQAFSVQWDGYGSPGCHWWVELQVIE